MRRRRQFYVVVNFVYSIVCNIRCMELSLLYVSVSVVCSILISISFVCISVVRISAVCSMLCVSVVISIVCSIVCSMFLVVVIVVCNSSVVCSIFYVVVFDDESIGSLREVEENKHHTDTKSQREQFNKAVNTLTNIFDNNFIDLFDDTKAPGKLVNFSTGTHATNEVEKSMVNSLSKGQDTFESFVREGLVEKIDGSEPAEKILYIQDSFHRLKTVLLYIY
ncbi:hypothetical protein DPMN_125966 [Dreissena polymorpha]|uniref:Uncharacterized protein n=1 Tax=Dreissena polymorpha TaxID=45954 RepID=A0A9D4JXI6_DREPO|nr:hypothetical protein DPMN_125966 [Dreissena polymorpha]